jgi:hypothetical protein
MTPNISEFTFEKLVKYNVNTVSELLGKLEIEIKALELEISYRNSIYNIVRQRAGRYGILQNPNTKNARVDVGKNHFSNSYQIIQKNITSHETQTKSLEVELKDLREEKQRVLLNQSLIGIDNISSVKFTPFVFNIGDFGEIPKPIGFLLATPYYASTSGTHIAVSSKLSSESSRLNTEINVWKNNEISQEKIIAQELKKQLLAAKIQSEKIIIPTVIPTIIPKIIPATIPAIDPAVLPSIVGTSSLIPLGVLAILLINSRKGKK